MTDDEHPGAAEQPAPAITATAAPAPEQTLAPATAPEPEQTPVREVRLEQPTGGGSYTRQPDGSLTRNED